MIDETAIRDFRSRVWHYYSRHARIMPWRLPRTDGTFDAYAILVSELMLQQTQVSRVIPKYIDFMARFPTIKDLAAASLADVLLMWSGLGYNRRAKFLHQAARVVVEQHQAVLPASLDHLVKLPGIGPNTAGAIMAYAYNQPVVFIETNIRSVIIWYFYSEQSQVTEQQIRMATAAVLDTERPREWYWALMDFGAQLKAQAGNHARQAKAYSRQSTFKGSLRQIRGQVLKQLLLQPRTPAEMTVLIPDERLAVVLQDLEREALIERVSGVYQVPAA